MSDKIFYFRYKNGTGDCFEPLATWETGHLPKKKEKKLQPLIEKLRGNYQRLFYVGFDSDDLKDPDKTRQRLKRALSGKLENVALTGHDEDFIAWSVSPEERERVRFITYSSGNLYFWKVPKNLKDLEIYKKGTDDFDAVWAIDPRNKPPRKRNRSTPSSTLQSKKEEDKRPRCYKLLPVEMVGKVSRHDLYTSIDSLAVLQFLTRGTCRPIWKIRGSIPDLEESIREENFPKLEKMRESVGRNGKQVPFKARNSDVEEEQLYGTFVRKYFDAIMTPKGKKTFFDSLEKSEKENIVIYTMNPILVETCAYYFCLDLGRSKEGLCLLPDVGKGKGLDVIDVRARWKPEQKKTSKKDIKERIEKLKKDNLLSEKDEILKVLVKKEIIEIQCKARGTNYQGPPHVMLFQNGSEGSNKGPVLNMQKFLKHVRANPNEWPLVARFLEMQMDMLKSIPRNEWKNNSKAK